MKLFTNSYYNNPCEELNMMEILLIAQQIVNGHSLQKQLKKEV